MIELAGVLVGMLTAVAAMSLVTQNWLMKKDRHYQQLEAEKQREIALYRKERTRYQESADRYNRAAERLSEWRPNQPNQPNDTQPRA